MLQHTYFGIETYILPLDYHPTSQGSKHVYQINIVQGNMQNVQISHG